MEWAIDHRGQHVRAQERPYSSNGFTCPNPDCRQPVVLKAGQVNRPHFAHRSGYASQDCEYYHPSSSVLRQYPFRASVLSPRSESLHCGLFLAYRPKICEFELYLRIPSLATVAELNGNLTIVHSRGTRSFSSDQFARVHIVSIPPSVPLLQKCVGAENLLDLSRHISSHADAFNKSMNMFVASENGGRFLLPSEPLEMGGRYWIVSQSQITPHERLITLTGWQKLGALALWHVYEAKIPSLFSASRREDDEIRLSDFFARDFRSRRPRAYPVYPFPHHFAADGAYIYPQSPEVIYIRRTSNHDIFVEGPPDSQANMRITAAEDWVQISELQLDNRDVVILIDDAEQAIIRCEPCELLTPPGIQAHTSDTDWDLLVSAGLSHQQLFSQEIRVECGNGRLAEYLARKNKSWILDGATVFLHENTEKILNAEGFGVIESLSEEQEIVDESKGTLSLKGLWIVSVIRMNYGAQMSVFVRDYIETPSQANLQRLGGILTSPYIPHILAAAKYQHKN